MRVATVLGRWCVQAMVWIGAAIVVVQIFWISYGVFMRYVLRAPDGMVTEATALLLLPLAFAGVAYALKEDAIPKVSILFDHLPASAGRWLKVASEGVTLVTGLVFAIAAVAAAIKTYQSGAASQVLLWPEYLFWTPTAFSLVLLVLVAISRIYCSVAGAVDNRY